MGQGIGEAVNALGDVFGSFGAMVKDAFSAFDTQFPVPDTSNLTLEQLNALTPEQASQLTPQQVNIFIGGADDSGGSFGNHPVLGSNALRTDVAGYNIYATHKDADEINAAIRKLPNNVEVNVIGHSYGGLTAAQVALNNPGRINKLITVDPVGSVIVGRNPRTNAYIHNFHDFAKVRNSVGGWVNVSAAGRPGAGDASNTIARIGGRWGGDPSGYATIHVNAPYNHGDFDLLLQTRLRNGQMVRDTMRR